MPHDVLTYLSRSLPNTQPCPRLSQCWLLLSLAIKTKIAGKEKSPQLDDGDSGFPPRDDGDGGGGGGGGGGNWSGGFFFFGFLAFLGFLKDKESEGPYQNDRRR